MCCTNEFSCTNRQIKASCRKPTVPYGEGGGQLLRTSVALAAISRQARPPVQRARRDVPEPGTPPQTACGPMAVAALCSAEVEGGAVRSREIFFRPGPPRGGRFEFWVGTAGGSITLVLQAVLPVAAACARPSQITIHGEIQDVRAAPPLDYFSVMYCCRCSRMWA